MRIKTHDGDRSAWTRRLATGCMLVLIACGLSAQTAPPPVLNSSELQLALDKLTVLGSVLYIAAHPDDENTALLMYFSKGRKLRTANLAITRGGGGQNLIGPELDDTLAALRTQELLAARQVDGAEQYFTRAIDFGYSKTSAETLSIWGREAVLADVVWVIRRFRPDVVITRFSTTAGGHGHHTASAILALEAFQAAADPARFPEQLSAAGIWQARRLVWNSWRPRSEEADKPKPDQLVSVDLGTYEPLLGKSSAEYAALARSMHRSQGFGAVATRGAFPDYFEVLAGTPAKKDLFEDLDLSWHRVPGSEEVQRLLSEASRNFDPRAPAGTLPVLLRALAAVDRLPADPWVPVKRRELLAAIRSCAGLWLEAIADTHSAAPGDTVTITVSAINRGGQPLAIDALAVPDAGFRLDRAFPLPPNQPVKQELTVALPAGMPCTQPYWLREEPVGGLHCAAGPDLAGLPEAPSLAVHMSLTASGQKLEYDIPVSFRYRDPVLGERYRPLAIVPPVMVNLSEGVRVFPDAEPREIPLTLIAGRDNAAGEIRFQVPPGWRVEPDVIPFALARRFDEQPALVTVHPPAQSARGELTVTVAAPEPAPGRGLVRIDYPHIPVQTLFPPAKVRLVRQDVRILSKRIGYVMGAGDDIPPCLRQLGCRVELLDDDALSGVDLTGFDAIVTGIRAYNTRPRLRQVQARLLEYVSRGGLLVELYNVNQGLVTENLGPYPFKLSRDRITDENAPLKFLLPDHPVLNRPNRIGTDDFQGWVQERGLYFAESWDPRYETILAGQDPGEKETAGGLLVARHGQGYFVCTGLSFFRQLPAGVPGAYRLLANLLSLGRSDE